jgi:hypothetical protein
MLSNWTCGQYLCIARRWKDETYAHGLEKVLGLLVDVELAALAVLGEVESRDLGDVLILALTLLLLKLERDTADGTTLNALHQVSGVAGNLKRWLLARCPIFPRGYAWMHTLLRRRLLEMTAISSQMRLLVSKSRVRRG